MKADNPGPLCVHCLAMNLPFSYSVARIQAEQDCWLRHASSLTTNRTAEKSCLRKIFFWSGYIVGFFLLSVRSLAYLGHSTPNSCGSSGPSESSLTPTQIDLQRISSIYIPFLLWLPLGHSENFYNAFLRFIYFCSAKHSIMRHSISDVTAVTSIFLGT